MGSITFKITETGEADGEKTYTVPDAHLQRLTAAYQQKGNTRINGTATRGQVLVTWAEEMLNQTKQIVKQFEEAAQREAQTPIEDISAS